MRVALVATPLPLADGRLTPGTLDGDVIRARLPLDDSGFRLVDLDPAVDLAEQLDGLFERGVVARGAAVLFYASCSAILSVEGELFLSLDPTSPDTGDSVRDLALLLRERSAGPLAFVLECRHAPDPEDPFLSASVVAAAREAVAAARGAIELLVTAHPVAAGETEDRVSPLTRALIEALDETDAAAGLTLAQFFESARESPQIVGGVPCFAHANGKTPFELLPISDAARAAAAAPPAEEEEPPAAAEDHAEAPRHVPSGPPAPAEVEAAEAPPGVVAEAPPTAAVPEDEASTAEMAPLDASDIAEVMAAVAASPEAPPPRAAVASIPVDLEEAPARPAYRSEVASVPVDLDEPPARPAYRSEVASVPVDLDEPPPARSAYRSEVASVPVDLDEPLARPAYRSEVASVPVDMDEPAEPEPAPLPRVMINAPPPRPAAAPPPAPPPPAPPPPASRPAPAPASPPASVAPPAPAPPPASVAPSAPAPVPAPPASAPVAAPQPAVAAAAAPATPRAPSTAAEHMAAGDVLRAAGDHEGALGAYKRALALLSPSANGDRAEIYARQGLVKQAQDKRREAIAACEKAIALAPLTEAGAPAAHAMALAALVELNVAEGDWKAVAAAEERVLAALREAEDRFANLLAFGIRWQDKPGDLTRARAAFERARDLRPEDTGVLERLCALYEQAGAVTEALATRQRLAELTRDPHTRAERWYALARYCLTDLRREELGLSCCDRALESDPTMLEPLALIAQVLADKQEWSELEQAYRRMLDRVQHMSPGPVRTQITWELCRRLGNTFRDHLDDPALALDAFDDAVHAKPNDLGTRLTAAEIARSIGKNDRAVGHLEAAAMLDPGRVATFHELFECFQKLRRPDQAYQAACVTMALRLADARERFIFEEHKPQGVPKANHVLRPEAWEWMRPHDRDMEAEAILTAVTPAAIAARLASLGSQGRLPNLDPAGRQDPEKSTVSIVRSFKWASHFLGVSAPAVYLSDDPNLALASVLAEEPTVFAGQKVLRGRSLPELAFFVGRHLAYHVGGHRLLLYYPSIEEMTACFLAALRIILPEVPAPAPMRAAVLELERAIALRITESQRVDLAAAVAAFEAAGSRAHLAEWVAMVERCATRAGYLLAGDLEVAAAILKSEPRSLLDADTKMADLLGFAVSDEHRALREALGIAVQP
jgi:tetratricopeptide (TPR) repeat protein